ncbi:MAG: hypothetical protein AAB595_00830 [Patescibacteria group bacterium]
MESQPSQNPKKETIKIPLPPTPPERRDREGYLIPIDVPNSHTSEAQKSFEKTYNGSSFFTKNRVRATIGALAAGLGIFGGYKGGKKLGWWDSHTPTGKKIEQKVDVNKKTGTYTSPATNLSAEAKKLANEPLTVEQIRAKLQSEYEKKLAEKETAFSNQLAEFKATNSAPTIPPKTRVETYEEIIAGIEAKLTKGEPITADEASIHNVHIQNLRPKANMEIQKENKERLETEKKARKEKLQKQKGTKITGEGEDGFNIIRTN